MELKLTIDRFEGDKAVLKTENNETIIWPKDKLPADVLAGAALDFSIKTSGERGQGDKDLAKKILNEILKPE